MADKKIMWPLNKIYFLKGDDGAFLNPRARYDGLPELAESIRQTDGPIEPLVLGPVEQDGPNEGKRPLLAGHRRVKAMRSHLNWRTKSVSFVERRIDPDDTGEILAVMLAANNGKPLLATEIGSVVMRLTTEFHWTPERIAQWCPMIKSPTDAVLYAQLLHGSTPQQIRDDVDSGKMAWTTWRTLSSQPADIKQQVVERVARAQTMAAPGHEVRPTGQRVRTAIKVARGDDVQRLLDDESLLARADGVIDEIRALQSAMPWAPNIEAQMCYRFEKIARLVGATRRKARC